MNTNINFSIIIPHNNIPDLLKRCLSSIPYRDDLEIIIVDDNSDKHIVDFNNFPGTERTNTIIIFSKENNRGAGYARNLGLQKANGKWILFADADDLFNPCLNQALEEYKSSNNDVIYFPVNSLNSETFEPSNIGDHINKWIENYNRTGDERFLRYVWGEPWCKLIKKDLITDNDIKFDETSVQNDTIFSFYIGLKATKIATSNYHIYNYMQRNNSITTTPSLEKILTRINVLGRRELLYRKNNIHLKDDNIWKYTLHLYNNKEYYNKAIKILSDIGFTNNDIFSNLRKQQIKEKYYKIKRLFK